MDSRMDMATYSQKRASWKEMKVEIEGMVGSRRNKNQLIHIAKRIKNTEMLSFLGQRVFLPTPITLAFIGKPGTGKSTLAKILGKAFFVGRCLRFPTVIEINMQDRNLVKINSARGGVLLIDVDELVCREAIEPMKVKALMAIMDSGETIVIFAGVRKHLKQLMNSNYELHERLSVKVRFRVYTPADIIKIIQYKMANEYSSEENMIRRFTWDWTCANHHVEHLLEREVSTEAMEAVNGYLADRILVQAIRNLQHRTEDVDDERPAKITITFQDLEVGVLLLYVRNGSSTSKFGVYT